MTGPARPGGPVPRDPGAQPERTRLAWRRTTLTFAVSVGLAARSAMTHGSAASLVAVAVALLSWLGFLGVAHRRIARMTAARPSRPDLRLVQAAALCTLAMTAAGALLLW